MIMRGYLRSMTSMVLLSVLLITTSMALSDSVLELPLGAEELKDSAYPVQIDVIRDHRKGDTVLPIDLASRLSSARIVLLGEEHTSMDFHRVQLAVIEALHAQGRNVIVGLEMFPFEDQPVLDGWVAGVFTESDFVQRSDWYSRWGYHWDYYRDIFLYARDNGLVMKGLNAPRKVISQLRRKGRDSLSDEQARHLPPEIDVDSAEHMQLFKSYFDADDPIHANLTQDQWRGMFSAQAAWDAVMGHNALRALQEAPDHTVVVVLVGAGHVAYGLGIVRQIENWSDLPVATLLPVPIADANGERNHHVQASYADFTWGIPASTPPLYPVLGAATIAAERGLRVIDVGDDSVAKRSDIRVGDRIVAVDNQPIGGRADLNRRMAEYRWGESIQIEVQRDGEILTVDAALRRPSPSPGESQ